MPLVPLGAKEFKTHLSLLEIYIFKYFAQFPIPLADISTLLLFSVPQGCTSDNGGRQGSLGAWGHAGLLARPLSGLRQLCFESVALP